MVAIGKWLISAVLGWVAEFIRGLIAAYMERKRREAARVDDNKAAEQKLEGAQSEQEIIDAGSDHLRR